MFLLLIIQIANCIIAHFLTIPTKPCKFDEFDRAIPKEQSSKILLFSFLTQMWVRFAHVIRKADGSINKVRKQYNNTTNFKYYLIPVK